MVNVFDVIIVGAGPSGSAAASVLSRNGHSVAILDRHAFPRPKLCGGLLTWKTLQELDKTFALSTDNLRSANLIDFISNNYSLFVRDKKYAGDCSPHPFLLTKRDAFDAHLLDRAISSGAKFFPHKNITHCSPASGLVATEDNESFQGKFIIAADGANSRIRRFTKNTNNSWRHNLATTIEISISRERVPDSLSGLDRPLLHVGFVNAGYSWVFPNSDSLVIGSCGLQRSNPDFKSMFLSYLNFLEIEDLDSLDLRGHPLPYGNHVKHPVTDRVFLVGDAGGFVEPMLGEGIFYALITGRYAAQSISSSLNSDKDAGQSYVDLLKTNVFPEFVAANRMRWLLLHLIKIFGYGPFKIFANFRTDRLAEMVHGLRSYRWLMKKKWQ